MNAGAYKVGQKWGYKTRINENDSTFIIIKIDQFPKAGVVIHVAIEGLKVKNPHQREKICKVMPHVPFSKEAIDKSVIRLIEENLKLFFFMDGYDMWQKAFDRGEAGIYTITIAEAIETMEKTLNTEK